MKLYFAGAEPLSSCALLEGLGAKCLMSYLNTRKKGLGFVTDKIFSDSGAFSAFTQGVKIDIDDYIRFIKENKHKIEVYANLDVIGDWKATEQNQKYIESKGLKPLPTFHFGSPLDRLKEMCEKYDYIALGGLVPYAKNKALLKQWLDNCFSIIKDKKPKIHGFGVNALWAWQRYPFYSVDATSWLAPSRFGQFTEMQGDKTVSHNKNSKNNRAMQLVSRENEKLLKAQVIEYMKMADYVTKLWETRGIKYENN